MKTNPFQDTRIFAENLAVRVRSEAMSSEVLPLAERLTETRYGLPDWNQDRRRR